MIHKLGQPGVGSHRAAAQHQADDGEEEGGGGGRVAGHHHQHQAQRLLLRQQAARPQGQPVQQEVREPGVLQGVGGGERAAEGGEGRAGLVAADHLAFEAPEDKKGTILSGQKFDFSCSIALFYTRGLGKVALHVTAPQPYGFSLCFFYIQYVGMVI